MDEQAILHHLIEVERNAAGIVEDAQKAAAAGIAENDRVCRAGYDAAYSAGYARLEADYRRELAKLDANYEVELNALRLELEQNSLNQSAFNAIAREFFASAGV